MGALEEARHLVETAKLPEQLVAHAEEDCRYWDGKGSKLVGEFTSEVLAASLSYQIKLSGARIADENTVPRGSTKLAGLPHLPRDLEWPAGMYFSAQINLADLALVDRSERLPQSGMLYFFFNPGCDCQVIHWDGQEPLEVRDYPDPATLADSSYYLEEFLKGDAVDPQPYWLFYLNDGDSYDYRETRTALGEQITEMLSSKLGAPTVDWDAGCRLYGRPHYWQGEDDGRVWPVDYGEHGPVPESESSVKLMLFQQGFGEGNVHFWCEADAARRGDFSAVWLDYSGT